MVSDPNSPESIDGREELIPTKDTLTALKSDVTRESAVKELIDNALDAWERNSDRTRPLLIEVFAETYGDRTELVIRDDAGGVPRNEAKMVFTLGMTAKSDGGGVIGTFGLGAKKALVNLGVPFTIASRHRDAEVGWEFTIDEEWFESDDWGVDITTNEELDAGETEIRIHDLNYDWFGVDDEDDGPTVAEELRTDIGRTYNTFLGDHLVAHDYDLTIEVENEPVEAVGLPDWSFTQFDGMYPRRFENIDIDLDGLPKVEMNVTVGLLRKKDGQEAGVDIYCQNRQIVHSVRDERVGFTGRGIGNFTVHHERLKAIVELQTEGDGRELPWTTQKDDIDRHNRIMQKANNWLRRIIREYYQLDANKVPEAFVEPYPQSSEYAANEGSLKTHDYEGRSQVSSKDKPNTDLPQLTTVKELAEAHAELRFRCTRDLEDWQVPAYKHHLNSKLDGRDYPDLTELPVSPVEFDPASAPQVASELEDLADLHIAEGVRCSAQLPDWQRPKYDAYVDSRAEADDLELKEVETPPEGVPATPDEMGSDGDEGDESDEGATDLTTTEGSPAPPDVELDLVVVEDGTEFMAPIFQEKRTALCRQLGLDENADRDEIAEEIARRWDLVLEMSAPAAD